MRVYRFMSLANGLDSIQARRLRIGRLVELNDPYDCAPGIAHAPNIPPGGEEAFEAGLFCPVCGSVWVVELQCHGFRSRHLESLRRRPSRHCTWFRLHRSGRWSYPVEYGAERRILNYEDLEQIRKKNAAEALRHVITFGFTKKASSWSYEQEYRQFITLNSCTPLCESTTSVQFPASDFSPSFLERAVLSVRWMFHAASMLPDIPTPTLSLVPRSTADIMKWSSLNQGDAANRSPASANA